MKAEVYNEFRLQKKVFEGLRMQRDIKFYVDGGVHNRENRNKNNRMLLDMPRPMSIGSTVYTTQR